MHERDNVAVVGNEGGPPDQDADAGQLRLTALAQALFGTVHGVDLALPTREPPHDLTEGWTA